MVHVGVRTFVWLSHTRHHQIHALLTHTHKHIQIHSHIHPQVPAQHAHTHIHNFPLFQSLASVSAYSFGNQYIMFTEQFQIGVRWDNLTEGIVTELSFAWILTMLAVDGVLYFLIGWYFHTVLNGEYW